MAPDVSICIVNWNGGDMLRNLLASLRVSDPDITIETIVVDNASTDDSVKNLEADFPEVILIRNTTNAGFATANDQCAEKATGRYLLFLNNDTLATPGTITRLVRFLDETPHYSAVGPKLIGDDGLPQRTGRNLPTLRSLLRLRLILFPRWTPLFKKQYKEYRSTFDPEVDNDVPQLAAAALMVRHDVFKKIGGWDQEFPFGVEDVDFCIRLREHGPIKYLSEVSIKHLGRISSRANYGFTNSGYEVGYARYLHKHHRYRWASPLYKLLITLDTPYRVIFYRCQYLLAVLTRRTESAEKAYRRLCAAREFLLHHLPRFWKA